MLFSEGSIFGVTSFCASATFWFITRRLRQKHWRCWGWNCDNLLGSTLLFIIPSTEFQGAPHSGTGDFGGNLVTVL